jgi:threonine dehydrogenase-like Zn-dependent dehydrogenase
VQAALVETVVVGAEVDAQFRLPLAEKLGAKAMVAQNLPLSSAFDVVFETSGSPLGVRAAIAACRTGGRVVAIGTPEGVIELDWNEIVMRGIRVVPIRARLPRHWQRAATVLAKMAMPDGFFSQFSIVDAADAFEEATLRRGLKVMIRPDGR